MVGGVSSVLGSSIGASSGRIGSGVSSGVSSGSGVVSSGLRGRGNGRILRFVGSSLCVGSGVSSALRRRIRLLSVAASSQCNTQGQGQQCLVDRHDFFLV